MAASDDLDPTLLARYLGGTALPADVEHLRQWVGDDLVRRNQLAALGRAWAHVGEVSAAVGPTPDVSSAWAGLAARAASAVRTARSAPVRGPHRWPRRVGGGKAWHQPAIAVTALIALAIGGGVIRRGAERHSAGGQEYATAAGQRLSVTLVDGTRVTLAPASRVQVAADYGRAARAVTLEGEAYFAVVHDAARPLTVVVHGAVVQDVGTSFDVRAYPEDANTRVAVTEGVVAIASAHAPLRDRAAHDREGSIAVGDAVPRGGAVSRVEVRGGDIATVARDRVTVQHGADVAAVTAWRQGGLVFADTPLSEALLEVGRWYDLDVRVADNPTTAGHVTAVFTADAPIGQVLHALESALEIRFERQGRTVIAHRIAGR